MLLPLKPCLQYLGVREHETRRLIDEDHLPVVPVPTPRRGTINKVPLHGFHRWLTKRGSDISLEELRTELHLLCPRRVKMGPQAKA